MSYPIGQKIRHIVCIGQGDNKYKLMYFSVIAVVLLLKKFETAAKGIYHYNFFDSLDLGYFSTFFASLGAWLVYFLRVAAKR